MIPTQIEREIRIDAPVEDVWRLLTEPAYISQWLGEDAELDLRKNGRGRVATSQKSYDLSIEEVDPPRRFSFRWLHPAGSVASPRNSTLVEFTLSPEASSTRLRVVESGFDQIDWSNDERVRQIENHTRGWGECFERLERLATIQIGGQRQA